MPSFKYSAKTTEGKTVNGTLVAENAAEVVAELRRKNLVIFDLNSAGRGGGGRTRQSSGLGGLLTQDPDKAKPGKAKSEELVVFTSAEPTCRLLSSPPSRKDRDRPSARM